jgi:hypothetical protein
MQCALQIVLSGRLLSPGLKITAILRWLGHKRQQLGNTSAIKRGARKFRTPGGLFPLLPLMAIICLDRNTAVEEAQ